MSQLSQCWITFSFIRPSHILVECRTGLQFHRLRHTNTQNKYLLMIVQFIPKKRNSITIYLRLSHRLPNHMPQPNLSILGIANLKFDFFFFIICSAVVQQMCLLWPVDTYNVEARFCARNSQWLVRSICETIGIRLHAQTIFFLFDLRARFTGEISFISFRFVWIHISTQILVHSSLFTFASESFRSDRTTCKCKQIFFLHRDASFLFFFRSFSN